MEIRTEMALVAIHPQVMALHQTGTHWAISLPTAEAQHHRIKATDPEIHHLLVTIRLRLQAKGLNLISPRRHRVEDRHRLLPTRMDPETLSLLKRIRLHLQMMRTVNPRLM